MTDECALAR